ncbi:MAG: patatin-like phospholipase family protein [Roseivirga sp.]
MKDIGLALGGGAVLGAAHIGAIRAMGESDIKVNHIAGTSIGALVATLYAFNKDWQEMKNIASELNWIDISKLALSRYGLLSNDRLGDLIIEHIGDKHIEDAHIPLALVATDVSNGKKVVLKKGSVAEAVMASTSIPGIFKPVEIDGQMLVDGGVAENVPVETVRDMSDHYVVGVDLNSQHTHGKPDNVLDVILNSFHFLMQKSDRLQTKNADLLIKPDLSAFNMSDMSQTDELVKQGYEESKKILKEYNQNF